MYAEAIAARAAGLKTCIVVREGNAPLTAQDLESFHIIKTFDQLFSTPAAEDGEVPSKVHRPLPPTIECCTVSSDSDPDDTVIIPGNDDDEDDNSDSDHSLSSDD